jgi:glycosyltransferase involved in cell wall biosynthesis
MREPRVLAALPVHNEAAHVLPVIAEVRRFAPEILVVDDGSRDATPSLLSEMTDLHVVTHPTNLGYGAALRSAFEFALDREYDVLVTIDCDGQHEPRLIPELAARVFDPAGLPAWDVVSGSRYLKRFAGDSLPPVERRRINVEITREINARLGLSLTDAFCGFKAYRVESLRALRITELGYAMPLQLWAQAVRAGLRIVEHPVPLIYLDEKRSFGGNLDDGAQRRAYYLEVLDRESPCAAIAPTPCCL